MRTALPNAARDTVAPTLQKAQETLTDTVLPAMRDALTVARERGTDLLDHDLALEARRRGVAVVKAAKGDIGVTRTRPWRFGLGMFAFGAGFGIGVAWLARRLAAPIESYTHTMPVPSGTDGDVTGDTTAGATGTTAEAAGGTAPAGAARAGGAKTGGATKTGRAATGAATGATTGAAPAGTPAEDIDLRSGARTNA